MGDDRHQQQHTDPSKPTPELPSRKRLLPDTNPIQVGSFDSSLSSDSSSDRFRKKTRDLPNLSDCHSCGLHINPTNPKHKLQTLDSAWRIVLLCRKCSNRIESSQLCSYCFSAADADQKDCFKCRDCERIIHKDCVFRYKCSAPWSYCCSDLELGFTVCVDCWVPKLLANSIRVCNRKSNKNEEENCSRVSMEDAANDAKRAVEKKAAIAARAREDASKKVEVARRALELASGAVELVSKKDDNGEKNEFLVTSGSISSSGSDTVGTTTVFDDAELAFRLHRAMNSSPRITKNLCSMNSSHVPGSTIQNCDENLSVRSLGSRGSTNSSFSGRIDVCPNNKISENTDATVSEPSVNLKSSDSGSCIRWSNLKWDGFIYTRRCRKEKECREGGGGIFGNCSPVDDNNLIFESLRDTNITVSEPSVNVRSSDTGFCISLCNLKRDGLIYKRRCRKDKECGEKGRRIVGNCHGGTDYSLIVESQSFQNQDELEYELPSDDTSSKIQLTRDGNDTMLHDERCNVVLDRFKLKYSKRPVGSKAIANLETKNPYDDSCVESKAKEMELPLNCSEECRTFSTSFQCCTVSLQALDCARVQQIRPEVNRILDGQKGGGNSF